MPAMFALIVLAWAMTMGVQAEDPAAAPAMECAPQPTLPCGGVIFGRAFIDHADDGQFEPGPPDYDEPQVGITIRLTDGEGTTYERTSDADGCFAFLSLKRGCYEITTSADPTLALYTLHDEPLGVELQDGKAEKVLLRYERLLATPKVLYFPLVAR